MKKIVLTLILLGICTVANSQNLNALDENNGFQNYKFGMHQDSISNCNYTRSALGQYGRVITTDSRGHDVEQCSNSDTHYINDIEVYRLRLYFIDSKLSKIRLTFMDSRQISPALIAAFGKPTSTNTPSTTGLEARLNQSAQDFNRNSSVAKWEGDKVILTYEYGEKRMGGSVLPTVEFRISNFDEKLQEFRSKKYTPSDF